PRAVGAREVLGRLPLEEQRDRQPRERDEAIEEAERERELPVELMGGELGRDTARRLEHQRRERVVEVQRGGGAQVPEADRPRDREAVARRRRRPVLIELDR